MKRLPLFAVLLLLLATGPVFAGPSGPENGLAADQAGLSLAAPQVPVPFGGLWQEFWFGAAGTPAAGCAGGGCVPSSGGNAVFVGDPPWTFTAPPGGADLTVTDAFLAGDVFEVFDFGVSLGTTSPAVVGPSCGDDPAICVLDPLMSHRVFTLAAGNHSITITPVASPHGGGAAYFRTDPPPDDDGDGVLNGDDLCPATVIPEGAPTQVLGVNRWALVTDDGVFDTTLPAGTGPERSYTIWDTAGCSCEQIIAAMGLGAGHTKFGCSISAMDDWINWID